MRSERLDPRSFDLAIGGQAVIEGVMMRCPGTTATAVRTPSGRIVVKRKPYRSFVARFKLNKIAFVRGGLHLIESLALGISSLMFSAEQALEDERVAEKKSTWKDQLAMAGTMVFAFGLSLLLFFWLPLVATDWIMGGAGLEGGLWFNVIDGILRLAAFLLYLVAISAMPDMKRLFQYHGAEHKTIHVFEAGLPLVPENADRFTTLHPRCGTSFLMFVMMVSILVFMTLGRPESIADRLTRLAFVPVIGGISYEFIKLSGKKAGEKWMRPFVWPGLMLQHITTREPSHEQVAVAMAALEVALEAERDHLTEETFVEFDAAVAAV